MKMYYDIAVNGLVNLVDKFVAWRNSRPDVPWLSSWFPQNEKRKEELRNGVKSRWLDPWF